jgi:hypothetical protein
MSEAQLDLLVAIVGIEKDKVFALPMKTMSRADILKAVAEIRSATNAAVSKELGQTLSAAWAEFRYTYWHKKPRGEK